MMPGKREKKSEISKDSHGERLDKERERKRKKNRKGKVKGGVRVRRRRRKKRDNELGPGLII